VNYCVDRKKQDKQSHPAGPLDVHRYFSKPSIPGSRSQPDRKYNKTKQRKGDRTN